MILSHFSHADATHLLFNMVTLFIFGPVVEQGLGPLGASDSISGILFAAIVLAPEMRISLLIDVYWRVEKGGRTMSRDSLLQPSLSNQDKPVAAPYSVQATFLTGFFGGPFGAIAIQVLNSIRLRRLTRDVPIWTALVLVTLAAIWALHQTDSGGEIRTWFTETLGDRNLRLAYRLLALSFVAVGYFLHRVEQRSTDHAGLTRPNGWGAGLACVFGGSILLVVYVLLVMGTK
jgi:hypothetical protein